MEQKYANNPHRILNQSIDISSPTLSVDLLHQQIRDVVREIVSVNEGNPQLLTNPSEHISLNQLHGGLTNQLYHVVIDPAVNISHHNFIFRIYGSNTEMYIDRNIENIVFSKLSTMSFGPLFHGLFLSGRIEGYIPAKTLTPDEMASAEYYPYIAEKVAQLHQLEIQEIKASPSYNWVWNKISLFFQLAHCEDNVFSTDAARQSQFDALQVPAMFQEYLQLRIHIQQYHERVALEETVTDRVRGQRMALEEILCHNDLLSGNILYANHCTEPTSYKYPANPMTLIDYEYAAYNYRAYDFANHFCEFAGFDFDIHSKFPTQAVRQDYLRIYLQSILNTTEISQEFVEGFEEVVLIFLLVTHFFWGTWAIVQAKNANIDFDYLAYAKLRYDGYMYHKDLFHIASVLHWKDE